MKESLSHRAHVALWKLDCAIEDVLEQWAGADLASDYPELAEAIADLMIPYRASVAVRRDLLVAVDAQDPHPED